MKRLLIAFAMLLPLIVSPAGAQTTVTRTVTWTAPAVDATHTAAVSYIFQWRTVGDAAWITSTTNPTTTSMPQAIPTGTAVECRVAGVDAAGAVGPWSQSDPYTYKTPGACGKPVWN